MTFWYAPARAVSVRQALPSLLPENPPKEITTSPPALRIALIRLVMAPLFSELDSFHTGEQLPRLRMKARVNARTPVFCMTETGFTEPLSAGKMYGAPPATAALGVTAAWLAAIPPTTPPATTRATAPANMAVRPLISPPSVAPRGCSHIYEPRF